MLGSDNSFFDSPSFLQKIMKKKSSSKYNIRPLCTADIINNDNPWKKQLNVATQVAASYSINQQQQRTKTYNHPSIHHQYIPSRPPPSISPSISSTTFATDSTVIYPTPSCSTPTSQHKQPRKRPLSSEILIKIMDQRLMKMQQQQAEELMVRSTSNTNGPLLHRSVSSSTTNNTHSINTPKTSKSSTTARRRDSGNTGTRQAGNTTTMRRHNNTNNTHLPPSSKKLKTSKSVLNKLNHHHPIINHHTPQQQLIKEWPYVLTQDNDEQDRMVAQHYLLRTAFGGDFSSPIKPLLQKGIVVLDVGCGNGTWTMEMSTAFPKSTFIGIDQCSFYPKDIKPRNCHFRSCGSLVQPLLPFPDNSIDYIYQRDMNWGLHAQTWQPLLNEYQRILKPGGWIEFVEPELETHDSLDNECAMNDKLISGLSMRQQDPYLVHRLPTMLSINGFRRVEDCSQSFPLGWGLSHTNSTTTTASGNSSIAEESEGEQQEVVELIASSQSSTTSSDSSEPKEIQQARPLCSEFARAMSSQYLFLLKSLRPWLSTVMNLSYEKYDEYISGLPAEWSRAHTFVNWHCIIAQKPLHS